MEQFETQEKVLELLKKENCEGIENCYFITLKDNSRAKGGVVGGMEYPYDGVLINRNEHGIAMFYLKNKKTFSIKVDLSNLEICDESYHFIQNENINKVTVKNHSMFNKKLKSIIIETGKKKHCLIANVNEPLLAYHNDNLKKFIDMYTM